MGVSGQRHAPAALYPRGKEVVVVVAVVSLTTLFQHLRLYSVDF
jgi:hypothetical protein